LFSVRLALSLPIGEDRLRLNNAQINLDNFACASAIENKFSCHSACSKFGIVFGLHYRCLSAKIGCASTMLK
jgi:hypothetical protein